MEMDSLLENLQTSFVDELWNAYDDDKSGFLEKDEIYKIAHKLFQNIPLTQDFFGEMTEKDTLKYCKDLWTKCKEFHSGSSKKISKAEFTNFMLYINNMDEKDIIDFKELREKVEKREHNRLWKQYSKNGKIKEETVQKVLEYLDKLTLEKEKGREIDKDEIK